MHRGFKLELDWFDEYYYTKGLERFDANKYIVRKTLKGFVGKDGVIDGTRIQQNWFPQVKADVFISHSHKDRKKAVALAGWMQEMFGLDVFIDSCIWGYAADLLRLIDTEYCLNMDGKTFSYERRNQSTSHVHMMLSAALGMMIDKAECLFFLNTPHSVQTADTINKTESPWIYNEIAISQIIRKKQLSEYRPQRYKAFGDIHESLKIAYEVDLSHLQDITGKDLKQWKNDWEKVSLHESYPLDKLYALFPTG